ncbi:MAG: hypothetical protein IIA67_13780, partial [Planctomycetes bacterium]|nr:hypothetical protein [Planctomycetota bacterium]
MCFVGCLAAAQDVSSVASHAPAESCFAAVSADVAATCEAFQKTRLGETLCGPDFTPLVDELRRRGMAGPLNLRPAVGFDWSDLAELHEPGGLFVFPLAESKLGVAWIFGGSSSETLPGPLAAAERYFRAKGFSSSIVRHEAAELIVLKPAGKEQGESPRVLFVARDFYGVANSQEAAAVLLAVQPDRSLAADAVWQQANRATGAIAAPSVGDATVMVRPMELWELVRRAGEEKKSSEPPQPADAEKNEKRQQDRDPLAASRQLGFDGVQALAGRVTFSAHTDRDWQLQAVLRLSRPYEKALRLLELRQGPLPELPDWLGADVSSATFWRWDFLLAMKGFGNLFDEANEPGPDGVGLFEDMLDGLRDDPEGVQVDLRRDLFEQLGPDVLNVTDRRGPRTKEMPHGDRTLYVARVKDMARVIDALKRFYHGDERVRHVRSGNYEVWTVPEGSSLFVEGESDSVVMVRALAVGEGQMLFGTDVDQLNSAMASSDSGGRLKDDSDWSRLWRSLRERHGESGAFWAMSRLDQVLEPGYQRATTDEEGDAAGPVAALW